MSSDNNRCVITVMNSILLVIPTNESTLRNDIECYMSSLWIQSPEARKTKYCWDPLHVILNNNIKQIDTQWKIQLLQIFNGN